MSGLLLSPDEHRRFAEYCRREAENLNGLAQQMESMPAPPVLGIAKQYRTKAAAYAIVARDLDSVEHVSIEGASAR